MATTGSETRGSPFAVRAQLRELFTFPHPANDVAARLVAGMVAALALAYLLGGPSWLLGVLAYGFLARVLTGPKLSPLGLLATRVLVPLLGNPSRLVAGPPKRFAQTVGLAFSTTALVLHYAFGLAMAAKAVVAALLVFAVLESALGFCAGCFAFGYFMRWGLVPEETCERCNNLRLGSPGPSARV